MISLSTRSVPSRLRFHPAGTQPFNLLAFSEVWGRLQCPCSTRAAVHAIAMPAWPACLCTSHFPPPAVLPAQHTDCTWQQRSRPPQPHANAWSRVFCSFAPWRSSSIYFPGECPSPAQQAWMLSMPTRPSAHKTDRYPQSNQPGPGPHALCLLPTTPAAGTCCQPWRQIRPPIAKASLYGLQ